MTAAELESLRRALLRKGSDLAEKLAALMAGKHVQVDALGPTKPGETPIEKLRRYLALVDSKIKAIAAGTYGHCDRCHAEIPYVELEQMPWADRCTACAAAG